MECSQLAEKVFPRRKTKQIMIGGVPVGAGAPIVVQSMTKTLTHEIRATVAQIKRLEKAKIIRKYHADIDYRALGYDIHTVVMIRIKKGGLENPNLLKNVALMPDVVSLYASTGVSDIIAVVRAKNRDHLLEILKTIQSEKDVLRTTSYLILVTYKDAYQFNPITSPSRKEH